MRQFIAGFMEMHSIISFFIGLVPAGFILYRIAAFIIRKEIRIFKNLKRKIFLCRTGAGERNLERELALISDAKLFEVNSSVLDISNDHGLLEQIKKQAVIVPGYSPDFSRYDDIVNHAKRITAPLILFAPNSRVPDQIINKLQEYPYFDMCNTSTRLLTTIFNVAIVTPS